MPAHWKDASFYQLRTEGAFLISAVRRKGKTQFIHIKSLAGEPCIIEAEFSGPMRLMGPKTTRLRIEDDRIELNLQKGEEAVLYVGKKPRALVISEVPKSRDEMNPWGGATKQP
jgi:hypothetical protein